MVSLVVAAAALALPGLASAATYTVNSDSGVADDGTCAPTPDDCTYLDALGDAETSSVADTIRFAPSVRGTITLGSLPFNITTNVTIQGPGADKLALDGAGLYQIVPIRDGANVTIRGLTLRNGRSSTGGALYAQNAEVTIERSILRDNRSAGGSTGAGGAIELFSADLTINSSALIGNTASGSSTAQGGAIYSTGSAISISNSTLSGNEAFDSLVNNGRSGGIYAQSSTTPLRIESSTITANRGYGGGGIGLNGQDLELINSILYGNEGPPFDDDVGSSATPRDDVEAASSVIGDVSDVDFTDGSNNANEDPMLRPLTDNGGPTPTHAIGAGGPAYNRGSTALAFDQRGIRRPQERFDDIGAFELDRTGPVARIDAAPSGASQNRRPTIRFSSPTPDAARFVCSIDGTPLEPCSSPLTLGPLFDGAHTVDVRGVDGLGNVGPPARASFRVDTRLLDGDVTAKKRQKQKGKRIKIKVKAGADERVDLVGKGRVKVKRGRGQGKTFALKTVRKSIGAGRQTVLRLKPKRAVDAKKIAKLLKKGSDLRANPSVKFTDEAANTITEKRVVRLKRKR